jgi:hypothetical protein
MSRNPSTRPNVTHNSSHQSIDRANKSVQIVESWESAISKAKKKIARLKADIVIFQEMKDSGEPWPGTQSQDQNSEQHHVI